MNVNMGKVVSLLVISRRLFIHNRVIGCILPCFVSVTLYQSLQIQTMTAVGSVPVILFHFADVLKFFTAANEILIILYTYTLFFKFFCTLIQGSQFYFILFALKA